ncbi:type II secretion system F family protein [Piscinibacter sakaiensis]|uniref:type II secretion system F family protein n=1 Tax=Piscinibacter sakaiensis TaxID=1547922 RepID=UPI003AABE0B3
MPEFTYTAVDAGGGRQRGTIAADDSVAASQLLHERRLQPISLVETIRRSPQSRSSGKRQTDDAVALLIGEVATLLEAGVPLAEAIATLADAHEDGHPLKQVLKSIRGGSSFSDALGSSGLKLPVFVSQLVRAGESTGKLGAALRAAATHLEAEVQFAQEARNALLYPIVLIGSGLLATLVMFVFVVPRFATVLDNPKADLPWISKMVLGLGLWLTQHQVVVGAVLALLVVFLVWASRRADVRQAAWELAARLPVLGPWTRHAEVARWASLFAVLLNSRVPLLAALAQANETLRRRRLRADAGAALAEVRGGKGLSQALGDAALLDAAGLNLIRVGERAGSLGQTVASLARMHATQSQLRLKRFLVLLEPMAILMISLVLGGIMISVMLAITSLTNVL